MSSKENDIRLYIYSGYSILNKAPHHIHKHKSKEAAYNTIHRIREKNTSYRFDQFILIDYSEAKSKIIYIHNPGDEIPLENN